MKLRFAIIGLIIFVSIGFMAYSPERTSAYQEKESALMHAVTTYLDKLHFMPLELNDEYSEHAHTEYVNRLDGNKWFLLQNEIDNLNKSRHLLDDEARAGSFDFFDASVDVIEDAIVRAETIYGEVIDFDFDFTVEESIELDADKLAYCIDESELQDRWRKQIKYRILDRMERKISRQAEEDFDGEVQTEAEILEDSRKAVKKNIDRMFDRLKRNRRVDWLNTYMNALIRVIDPHSGYYRPKDKEDFDMAMSGTLEGIGAQLTQEKDYTKVFRIVPGGPAYKQKQLEVDDLIVKVAQDGQDPVDVVGWHIDDVVGQIRGKKGTKVTLTVKKKDGTVEDVTIIRDVIVFEDSYVTSHIVEHEKYGDKVGYIKLPSFYTSAYGQEGGRNSGDDVRKELEKLKADGVDGVILDLRNNGGGSLQDVVEMTGLFIEGGPVVQVKSRDRMPQVLKDRDPGVVYDGPVIVMVNSISASASEILPAALQDYNRAVIVGSNSTYGKGSVQRFYDLDRVLSNRPDLKPLGEIKLTTQKFYRINGGATQQRGVTPDIILPDRYMALDYGERTQEYAMPWTEINPVSYDQDVYVVNKVDKLATNSAKRVADNDVFEKIKDYAQMLKDRRDHSVSPLSLDGYLQETARMDAENEKFDDLYEKIEELKFSNLTQDIDYINADSTRIAKNKEIIKAIRKDVQLEEAIAILHDMIELEVN